MFRKPRKRQLGRKGFRRFIIEQFEPRLLLISDWQNPSRPTDVNNDLTISPLDALLVIDQLNSRTTSDLPPRTNPLGNYYDTSGDSIFSPLDALFIIDDLNHRPATSRTVQRIDGEAEVGPAGFISVPLTTLPGRSGQIVSIATSLNIGREEFNEMGLFVVDSPDGSVNGIPPSSPDYGAAVFQSSQRQVLYSQADILRTARTATFPAGALLRTYVLQSATTNGDPAAHLRARVTGTNQMRIGWEEVASIADWQQVGDRGYDDAIVDVQIGTPFDGNAEPVITAIPNQSISEETPWLIQPIVMDADLPNDGLVFTLDIAPAGATIDRTTGTVRWNPTESQGPGNFEFILRATDRASAFDTESFFVTVLEVNRPPALEAIGDIQVIAGQTVALAASATDPDLPANTLTFSLGASAPSGAAIDAVTGRFTWTPDSSFSGKVVPVTVIVTDNGTPSLSSSQTFDIDVDPCVFESALTGWTAFQSGGTTLGKGSVTGQSCAAVMLEGDSFVVGLERSIVVPTTPSAVRFTFSTPQFDESDTSFINDAFELSVVDTNGKTLVFPYAAHRDAFLNVTEGLTAITAPGVTSNGSTVTVDLSSIAGGTAAKVVLRLINNDGDTTSQVVVSNVELIASNQPAPSGTASSASLPARSSLIDTSLLTDISGSFVGEYSRTSFNEDIDILDVEIGIRNAGQFATRVPLYVGVKNISDATVRVSNADALTTDGIPLFDFTTLVPAGQLPPSGVTGITNLQFFNPQRIQFDYDLVFYGQLNRSPVITSEPITESIVNRVYRYNVTAIDPDADPISYSLVTAPPGMTINAASGVITWTPATGDIGTTSITVRVEDGRGGFAEQRYVLNVITAPPNRPPVITSTPVVSVNLILPQSPYRYDVIANDPDADVLTYSLSNAPAAMQIDPLRGNILWNPTNNDIGNHNVIVTANDGRGGIATQQYMVQVNADPLNHAPVIVSDPVVSAVPETSFKYDVNAIDADDDVLRYSLTSGPDSMTIDSASGLVSWDIPADIPSFEFAHSFGGNGRDDGRDVATDSQGNIYLTGFVSSTVDLDPGPGVANVVPSGTQSAFVAKYSPDGTLLWLRALGGAGSSTSNAIIIDRNDNIYLAGNFRGTVDFDPSVNQFPLSSSTNGASFVWKLDTSGNFVWVRATEGNPDEVSGEGLAVDDDGNVILLTNFYGTIDADPGANVLPFSGVNRVSSDGVGYKTDILLVKLSSEGILQWARHFGDSRGFIESQRRSSIATNAQGDVLLTGRFQFTMDFDPGPAVQIRSSVNSSEDIFALKLTSAGDLAWVRTFDGTAADRGVGIDTDQSGNIAITGIFAGTLDLDPGASVAQVTASNPNQANFGYNAPLILLDTDGQFRWGSKVEGFAYGVTFDDVGSLYTIGSFGGLIDFDPGQAEFKLDGGATRWYTAKYSNSGDFIWAHASGGYAITVDCHGYVVSTGYYSGRFDFDPTSGVREFTSSGGSLDAFLTKTTMAPTCADVTVRVEDGRGGFDTQSFTVKLHGSAPGEIRGTVFNDLDGNRVSLAVGQPTVLASGGPLIDAVSIAISPDDSTLYVTDYSANGVFRLPAAGGTPVMIASGPDLVNTRDIAISPDGMSLYVIGGQNGIVRVPTTGGQPSLIAAGLFGTGIAVSPDGSTLYFLDSERTGILRMPATGGPMSMIGSGFPEGIDVAISDDGQQLYITTKSGVFSLSTGGGVPVLLGAGNHFIEPVGIALTKDQKTLLIIDGRWRQGLQTTVVTLPVEGGTPQNAFVGSPFAGAAYSAFSHGGTDLFVADTGYLDRYSQGLPIIPANTPAKILKLPIREAGLQSWTVYLDDNRNGNRDLGERFTLTDMSGGFSFPNLTPGDYKVSIEPQIGWIVTTRTNAIFDVQLEDGQIVSGIDFGVQQSSEPPINQPPIFVSAVPTTANSNELYRYDTDAFDPDIDPLTYELVVKPSGMAIQSDSGIVVWIPSTDQVGSHDVTLRVSDGRGGVALQSFVITVAMANSPPVITSSPRGPAVVGLPYEYRAMAQDADGDPIVFSLGEHPAGMTIDANSGVVSWTPAANQVGSPHVDVIVSDNRGASTTQSFDLPTVATAPNRTPNITSIPRGSIRLGSQYLYAVIADDPDGDPLVYSLPLSPTGMAIDPKTGLVTWTPTGNQMGAHDVQVKVDDGRGASVTQSFTVTVVNQSNNRPPNITSTPPAVAVVGRAFAYDVLAVDPDGDPLAYSLDESPNGMSVSATAGSIRWTPTADQLGQRTVVVRVIDGQGGFATQTFTINVRAVNTPPSVTSTPPTFASIGNAYSYAVRATDIDGDALTFTAITLPPGMTIDSRLGLIRWTPAANQLGSHEVAFRVDDGQGGTATQIYSLVVTATAANNPPVITSNPNFVATVESLYQYNVTASDADGDTLTYQLQNPPAGMLINATTGVVTWTPTAAQLGTHTITVAAIDGQAGGTQTFTLRVATANRAPTITSQPPPGVVAGLIYRYDVKASDPDGDPLTYTLDSAPPGMTIDNLGRITWQTTKANVGTHRIAVSVEDDRGLVITQTFDIAIIADGKTPLVNLIVKPGNRVAINSVLTFIVTATDNVGVKSIGLTINGNAVPLDAAGRVSFTATPVGLYDIVASATDDAGNTGLASTQVLVFDDSDKNPPVVSVTSPLDNAIVSAPIDVVGTASDANLAFYTLSVAPVGSDTFTEIVRRTASVTAGVLGKFDPTGLANDSYILRLEATDTGGNVSFVDTVVQVAGDLKIGNFTLSFTDMTVPVSGIPITVSRTYDTLQANQQDDFGFGWRLEFRDTNLRTSVPSSGEEEYGYFTPYYDGARVYVTAPGGRREGFTFRPRLVSGFGALVGFYNPVFVPDAGVTSQLSVNNFTLIRSQSDGLFYGANGLAYNPTDELNFGGRFYLTTKDGIAYEIDATTGDLVTLSDANRNVLTFTEAAIESNRGPRITFQRDPQGRITSVTDPSGNRVQYQYDAKGDLISVTDRESNVTRFVYSEPRRPHFLTEIIDPLGRTGVRTEYDAQGRLMKLIDAAGNPVQLNHDPENSIETVTDALGNSTSFEYDARGNVVSEVDAAGGITRRTYDSANNMLTERDPLGNVTTFTYDGDGNLLTETNPLGNVTRNTYTTTTPGFFDRIRGARPVSLLTTTTDPLGNTTTNTYSGTNLVSTRDAAGNVTRFAYDAAGNQTSITDAAGNVTSFEYDTRGNLTRQVDALGNATLFAYDANGNQLSQSTTQTICGIGFLPVCPAGGPSIVRRTLITSTTYDAQGRPISVTDAEGHTTRTEYDKLGNQIASVDALGRRTSFTYDDRGQLIGNTFPDGTTTSTSYDALGRRVGSTDRAGRVTRFVYDALGRLTTTIYPDTTPASDTDNPRTRTEYDLAGRVTAQIDELGHRTEIVYDAAGRQTVVRNALGQETSTSYDIAGRTMAATDALGNKTQFVYDTLGRQIRTQFADGTTTSTSYDALGRSVAQTDQAGRVTMYEYDSLGRLTAVVDALGQRTQYTYDEAGNLLSQRDANGNVTRYEYDGVGRRTAHVLPLGQRSTTVYDAVGNVTRTTDFNGDAIVFGYDVVNRLTSKSFPDSTSVQFTYNVSGQRETYIDARGTTRWAYDVRDRLISRTDPDGRIISYTYDAAGNRTSLTVPSGTTNYTFDQLNRTSTVTDPEGGLTRYTYDAGSRLIRTDLPNGTVETRQYDVVNHLLFLENRNSNGVISSYRYTLDPTGNRTAVVEDTGRRVEYFYDELYRLTRESIQDSSAGNRNITYTYDPVGNRLLRTDSVEGDTSYTYDNNDRLLTETLAGKVTNYTYDNNGNTLSKISAVDKVFYDWDYENGLIGADTNGDGTTDVTYRYDGERIRVSSTVGSEETRFLIDSVQPYQQVIEEYTAGGVIKVSYVHGLDLISQNRVGEGKTFYHVDGLGSTRALSNASGTVTDRYVYEAFGRTIGQVGSSGNVYLFAGEQRDGAVGLDYLRARWISPNVGRFYGMDPFAAALREPRSVNRFLYTFNSPVNFVDPRGLFTLAELSANVAIQDSLAKFQLLRQVASIKKLLKKVESVITSFEVGIFFFSIGLYSALADTLQNGFPYRVETLDKTKQFELVTHEIAGDSTASIFFKFDELELRGILNATNIASSSINSQIGSEEGGKRVWRYVTDLKFGAKLRTEVLLQQATIGAAQSPLYGVADLTLRVSLTGLPVKLTRDFDFRFGGSL